MLVLDGWTAVAKRAVAIFFGIEVVWLVWGCVGKGAFE